MEPLLRSFGRRGGLVVAALLAPSLACSTGSAVTRPATFDETVERCRESVPEPVYHAIDPGTGEPDPGIEPPEKLQAPQPTFPRQSQLRFGQVRVATIIDVEGRVVCPQVLTSTAPEFARALLEVLPRWRFRPARRDGDPVAIHYELTTTFRRSG